MTSLGRIINACRLCGSSEIEDVLDFGDLSLTGLFLNENEVAPKAHLTLINCSNCGLVQLKHSYPKDILYGSNYGYESHLNKTMLKHLHTKAMMLSHKYLDSGVGIVVDIASNDGSFLSGFKSNNITTVGIDPIIHNLTNHYPISTIKIPEFFSAKNYLEKIDKPASLVTSLSVLYDLEDPLMFAKNVYEILEDGGVWHFEQSYLPSMVNSTSYDTVCHEHLLYLSMHNIKMILDYAGFSIIEVSLNDVNGGSAAVTAIKQKKSKVIDDPFFSFLLKQEIENGFTNGKAIQQFKEKSLKHKDDLNFIVNEYDQKGFKIHGLGASTKGNVLLQWANLDNKLIKSIGDINPRKFGKVTPGTNIKIVNEVEILNEVPQKNSGIISLVLPWHFRSGIISRSEKYITNGGKLLFPLPEIQSLGVV